MITRDELLGELAARDIQVPVDRLRFWEYSGALSKPVRMWHPSTRAVRAMYPSTAIDEVARYASAVCPCCGQRLRKDRGANAASGNQEAEAA